MLIQLIAQQPQILGPILKNTPTWVWGLLATLLALGFSQIATRRVSALRMGLMPVAMTGLSLWGTLSAFSQSPLFGYVLLAWAAGAALVFALVATRAAVPGAGYDAATRSFTVPGSWLPLALILGIFLTKYAVGVATAMQPALRAEVAFAMPVAVLYGVFSGLFAGRTLGLLRLARPQHATGALTLRTTA